MNNSLKYYFSLTNSLFVLFRCELFIVSLCVIFINLLREHCIVLFQNPEQFARCERHYPNENAHRKLKTKVKHLSKNRKVTIK